MSTLTRKLFRTIANTRGQFIALVVIVALGVMIYVSMNITYSNLAQAQQQFYERNRFADYTFLVIKAPESVVARVEAVPGVIKATGRLQKDVTIFKDNEERAVGRLTGFPVPMRDELNKLFLLSGRSFDEVPSDEIGIIVDPQYAEANAIKPGSKIEILADSRKVDITVIGTAISPEFIYPMKDSASLFPEPEFFGILMMPQKQVQQILGMPGQINQVLLELTPDADEALIKSQVGDILKPYGNIADYPRKSQSSHVVLQAELDGIKLISTSLPILFFLIAAGIQFVILSRLIRSQRLSIGVMKALGYNNRQIIWNYTSYALLVSLLGSLVGNGLGLGVASGMTVLFAQYFNLPPAALSINLQVVLISFLISSLVGGVSGLLASRSVLQINPAEAMRPQPPAIGRRTPIEDWAWLWNRLSSSWKMSLRSMFRNRTRFSVTILGVMSAVVLLMFTLLMLDATDHFFSQSFEKVNHYDYMVRFSQPINESELLYWNGWDEVQRSEGMMEIPVKVISDDRSVDDVIVGLDPSSQLKKISDKYGVIHGIPEEGILINSVTADNIGLAVGDVVTVETVMGMGAVQTAQLTVMDRFEPMTGAISYVSLETANRLLGERQLVTAAMLKLDAPVMSSVEKRLKDMSRVSSVVSFSQERAVYEKLMGTVWVSIGIMLLFAIILGIAIIYNTSVMTLNERQREMASLRVLGYSKGEVAGLIRKETWIQAAIGIALGLPVGRVTATAYLASATTEMYSLPAIIYPRSYLIVAIVAFIFVWMGQSLSIRKAGKLDMVEVLKNRE
ncbi:MAG: FtsX-like permease family protein [Syntrophomonadaceae bacterium]|nr:FtsX-like permease family protein [Syntrophomonadaceae bacterium]